MIKAIVFDLDNTLLDFMKMKNVAIEAGLNGMHEAGLNIDVKKEKDKIISIYKQKGWEYQEVFDYYLEKNYGKIDFKLLAAAIIAYRKAKDAALILYPNINKTLIFLSKHGYKLGVVSDAPSREAWLRLYSVNLHHIFDAVITFDDTGEYKPSSKPFKAVLKKLNVSPKYSLMVGDWPERDVIGAKKIGMKTVFAKYGDSFNTKLSGADYDINNISELVNIINKENKH